jgi:chorismate-pyruvate lyase
MATPQIREALHEYIDTADEKKLEAIYIVLKDSISSDYAYSEDELATIYSRRYQFLNGVEQVLTTEEFINYVRQNTVF